MDFSIIISFSCGCSVDSWSATPMQVNVKGAVRSAPRAGAVTNHGGYDSLFIWSGLWVEVHTGRVLMLRLSYLYADMCRMGVQ